MRECQSPWLTLWYSNSHRLVQGPIQLPHSRSCSHSHSNRWKHQCVYMRFTFAYCIYIWNLSLKVPIIGNSGSWNIQGCRTWLLMRITTHLLDGGHTYFSCTSKRPQSGSPPSVPRLTIKEQTLSMVTCNLTKRSARLRSGQCLQGIAEKFDPPPYSEQSSALKMVASIRGLCLQLKEQL